MHFKNNLHSLLESGLTFESQATVQDDMILNELDDSVHGQSELSEDETMLSRGSSLVSFNKKE